MSVRNISSEKMIVAVYGPSGVGKTTALRFATGMVPGAEFASLDDVVATFGIKNGIIGEGQGAGDLLWKLKADEFLRIGIQAANERLVASPTRALVLDVGAGFLESGLAGRWLAEHKSIVFKASSEVAYNRQCARHPGESRTLDVYTAQEFSLQRCEYYAMASRTVDAEGGKDEVGRSLVQRILVPVHSGLDGVMHNGVGAQKDIHRWLIIGRSHYCPLSAIPVAQGYPPHSRWIFPAAIAPRTPGP